MAKFHAFLTALFGDPERIANVQTDQVYLWRWVIIRTGSWCLYLHHFVEDDWSRDFHDHPKNFISLGLWGSYIEETPISDPVTYRAPWLRRFSPLHTHRIRVPGKNTWSLVWVGEWQREWGFVHLEPDEDGVTCSTWTPWEEYTYKARMETNEFSNLSDCPLCMGLGRRTYVSSLSHTGTYEGKCVDCKGTGKKVIVRG